MHYLLFSLNQQQNTFRLPAELVASGMVSRLDVSNLLKHSLVTCLSITRAELPHGNLEKREQVLMSTTIF